MKGKQPFDRKLAVERRQRKEDLFTLLDAYLTTNEEMPTQKWVMDELALSERAIRNYAEELVTEGRLVRPGRWDSIRVAQRDS